MENQVVKVATDWWVIGATVLASIITALVTVITVYFTNKWTSERYEKDKIYQNKKNNLVIIKPVLKFCSFSQIIDESPKCLNGVIDKVELYSNGNLITDKYEQNLAFNFILFGNWQAKQYIEFNEQTDERVIVTESNPIKGNEEEQPFYMIGTLSSLISNKYKYIVNYYQSSNSNFPKITPEKLSLDIDENNYIGKILHIWRFKVNKNM